MKIVRSTSLFAIHSERLAYRVTRLSLEFKDGGHHAEAVTVIGNVPVDVEGDGPEPWDALDQVFEKIRDLHAKSVARGVA